MSIETAVQAIAGDLAQFVRAVPYVDGMEANFGVLIDAETDTYYPDVTYNPYLAIKVSVPYVWITTKQRGIVRAVNMGVSYLLPPGSDVLAFERRGGGWIVTDVNPDLAPYQLGGATGSYNSPDKSPAIDSSPIISARLMPGRVRPSDEGGLWVTVEAFEYEGRTVPKTDLLLVPTATSGAKALTIVTYDPATNSFAQTLGDDEDATYAYDQSSENEVRQDIAAIATPGQLRLAAVLLASDDTTITSANIIDIRVWLILGTPNAVVQTTDTTTTTLLNIAVEENSAIRIVGHVIGVMADYSASAGRGFQATVRRAIGGNVTLVGAVQYDAAIQEDSSGSPTIEVDVDIGTQMVRVRVQGLAAETWNWKVSYQLLKLVN